MICPPERPIFISKHAEEQARKRYPQLRSLPQRVLFGVVSAEVALGIRAGRVSKRQPRSTVWNGGSRGAAYKGRFVRSEDGSRCWLVRESHGALVVVTCFSVLSASQEIVPV